MKKFELIKDNFQNRMVISVIGIFILSLFNLWFSYHNEIPVKSAISTSDKLSITEVKRLTHPDYSASNNFYGVLNPFNLDETRLVMYEVQQSDEAVVRGRGYVWGYIGDSECAENSPCLLDWNTRSDYEQAAKVVPTVDAVGLHRWKSDNLFWSTLAGEEAILYSIPNSEIYKMYRINLEDSSVTEIASFDPQDGTDLTNTMCYGITDRNTLRCSFNNEDWSNGGFEVNIISGEIDWISNTSYMATANPAVTYCQAHPGATLPAQYYGFPHYGHGHSAKSVNGLYHALEYGTGQGVWRLSDCTYLDDQNYEFYYPHDLYWRIPTHVTWNNSQDNYFFGSTANSFYDSSQSEGHNVEPWLKPVSLFQIIFNENTQEFEYNHLTSFLTAGKWNADAPVECSSDYEQCSYQWKASPLSFVNRAGRKLLFTSTMGNYSYLDHNLTGVTPYGTNGVFMATLALNSQINECIDNDGDGFGVNCVWGADCNDNDYYTNPNIKEVYDGIDNNCNAQIDCADDPSLICSSKNLYVDVSSIGGTCSDSKTRSSNNISNPFCSLQRASEVIEPGDTVLVRQGTYNEHGLNLDRGGTINHVVTFKPYQSESVNIIFGEKVSVWSDLGGGFYSKDFSSLDFDVTNLKVIKEGGNGLMEADSLANLQNISYAPGESLFYVNDVTSTVYLRLIGLTTSSLFFVDKASKVNVISPYITWENLDLSYAYQGFNAGWYGIWDNYSAHGRYFTLNNSTISHTYYEGLYSRDTGLTVANNLFNYNGVLKEWDVASGQLTNNYDASAIYFIGSGALIENNVIKNGVTGLSYRADSGTVEAAYRVQNSIIRNNEIYGRVVGSGLNNLFYNNIVNYLDNVAFSLYYQNKNNKVYNNLFYSNSGVLLSRYAQPGEYVDFRNNVIFGFNTSARCLDFDAGLVDTFTLDYNIFYNCHTFYRNNIRIANTFTEYKNYMSSFSEEVHSLSLDPGLASPEAEVAFYPSQSSATVDQGTSLSSVFNFDKDLVSRPYNNLWDIGPYEFNIAVVAPSCSDGIQNGSETGVDCGGSCSSCSVDNPNNEGGETPPPTTPPATPPEEPEIMCGNAIQESGEQCDDGNLSNNDGCSYLCQVEADVTPTSTPNALDVLKLQGSLVKLANDPRIYYINQNNQKYFIPNLATFKSWFKNFNSLQIIDTQTLSSYPYLGRLTVKPGNLIKFKDSNKIYAVEPTKTIRWITTGNIFKAFGYDFSKVINLPQEDFVYYTLGADIVNSDVHPSGQLLKHGNFPPIFYLKDGIEYWIKDETTFLSLGFKWQDIVTIPVRYWYTRVLSDLTFKLKDR